MQTGKINIAFKYAEIDDKPYSVEHEGWVSRLVEIMCQTLKVYFDRAVVVHLKKETDLINEKEFKELDAIIYILSPAFLFSSNIATEISAIEKAVLFDTNYLNSKIHKVLKGPVKINELPVTISMGTYHYFYQLSSAGDTSYETLFDWDNSVAVRNKYWESFTNLLFDLLKHLQHPSHQRFIPPNSQTVFLGTGEISQLWNRTNLLGELNSRGVKVLPDHDHSIEVKHLNDPVKYYLKKSNLAIHFPEEFLPLDPKKIQDLSELTGLRRFIWFDPEAEKDLEKKKYYDELKQALKNLDHVEVVGSGLEVLKEIVFAATAEMDAPETENKATEQRKLYLICSEKFPEKTKNSIIQLLRKQDFELLLIGNSNVRDKRVQHYQNLKEAHQCLICFSGDNAEWLQANINEVKKSRGLNLERSKKVRLGIISGEKEMPAGVSDFVKGIRLISALSGSFEDDLNTYLNEK